MPSPPNAPSAGEPPNKSVTSNQTRFDTTDDVQIVVATKTNSLALKTILLLMSVKLHEVEGDGNCLLLNCSPDWEGSQSSKDDELVSH